MRRSLVRVLLRAFGLYPWREGRLSPGANGCPRAVARSVACASPDDAAVGRSSAHGGLSHPFEHADGSDVSFRPSMANPGPSLKQAE